MELQEEPDNLVFPNVVFFRIRAVYCSLRSYVVMISWDAIRNITTTIFARQSWVMTGKKQAPNNLCSVEIAPERPRFPLHVCPVPSPRVCLCLFYDDCFIATHNSLIDVAKNQVCIWVRSYENLFLFPGYSSEEFDRLISSVHSNFQALNRELRSKLLQVSSHIH